MALVRTTRIQTTFGSAGAAHGAGAATTAAFTPSNNSVVVVAVSGTCETDAGMRGTDLTLTNSLGLAQTSQVHTTTTPSWSYGLRVWTIPIIGAGASMTVSADCGAFNMRGYRIEVFDYTGYNTLTPAGATGTGSSTSGNGPGGLSLSQRTLVNSAVLGFLCTNMSDNIGTEGATPGVGFTELGDAGVEGWFNFESEEITNFQGNSVEWADMNSGTSTAGGSLMVGLEILAAVEARAAYFGPRLRRRYGF